MQFHHSIAIEVDLLTEPRALPTPAPVEVRPRSVTISPARWHAPVRFAAAMALVAAAVGVARYAWYDLSMMGLSDPESSHVLLVPVVFAWIAWHRRDLLRAWTPGKAWTGTGIVALGWLLWSMGYRFQIQSFWHGGAVTMAVGAAITVIGGDVFRALLPAFGALVFLVPVPATGREWIAVPLQRVTALATQFTSELVGLNVQRTGSLLRINGVDVAIAEACNGMRLVFTLFLACYLFAFVTPLRWPVRLLILLLAPAVAVVANVVRLVPTVWMYGHASAESAERFHDAAGWAMLVIAFLGLMGVVRLLRWIGLPVDPIEAELLAR
jgi:exosortase